VSTDGAGCARASGALFPVHVKDAAYSPPDAAAFYLLTADGLFLERTTPLFSASIPVDQVPGLQPHRAALRLRIPRVPAHVIERAVAFFRVVYERWQGEGIVILFYAPPSEGRSARFFVDAPPQLIRGRLVDGRFQARLHLEYGSCDRPGPEFVKLGTIHSHAEVSATASCLDAADELYETGLHVIVGRVDRDVPELAAAFVAGRTRFKLAPEDVLSPLSAVRRVPPAWLGRVTAVLDGANGMSITGGS
jgi:hypothetical protein